MEFQQSSLRDRRKEAFQSVYHVSFKLGYIVFKNVPVALSYVEGEKILGRIAGVIDYENGCLNIEAFAVEKEARGKGVGKQLLKDLEARASAEGCNMAFVDTLSFSAPGFYQHEGYTLLGTIDDYPEKGITKYWYYKRL